MSALIQPPTCSAFPKKQMPQAYVVRLAGTCCKCAESGKGSHCRCCNDSGKCDCGGLNGDFVVRQSADNPCCYEHEFVKDQFASGKIPCKAEKLRLSIAKQDDGRVSACVVLFFEDSGPVTWHKPRICQPCRIGTLRRIRTNRKCCFPQTIVVNGTPVSDFVALQPEWYAGDPEDLNDAPFWPTEDLELGEVSEFAPVRYANGELQLRIRDVEADGYGVPWGHTRIYSNRLSHSHDFGNGYNWLVLQWPQLARTKSPPRTVSISGQQGKTTGCTLVLLRGTSNALWFDELEKPIKLPHTKSPQRWLPRFGAKHVLSHDWDEQTIRLEAPNGHRWEFYDFSCNRDLPTSPQGAFKKHISPGDVEINATYQQCRLQWVARSDATTTELFDYKYYEDGANEGRLHTVTLKRTRHEAGISRAEYLYYDDGEKYGHVGDLKMAASQILKDGDWRNISVHYYRYHKQPCDTYCQGLLHQVLGPEAFRRLYAQTPRGFGGGGFGGGSAPTPSQLDKDVEDLIDISYTSLKTLANWHADHWTPRQVSEMADLEIQYDNGRRVSLISMDAGARRHRFTYQPKSGPPSTTTDHNLPCMTTCETRSDFSTNTVHTNRAGQVILRTLADGKDKWMSYREYDKTSGRLKMICAPSSIDHSQAVSPHNAKPQTYTRHGLVTKLDYHPTGYLKDVSLGEGKNATNGRVRQYEYKCYDRNTNIFALVKTTKFGASAGKGPKDHEVKVQHTWHAGNRAVKTQTTTFPLVAAEQNGPRNSRVAPQTFQRFDTFGNLRELIDLRQAKTISEFRTETGALKSTKLHFSTLAIDGTWVDTVHDTEYESDVFGRITKSIGPETKALTGDDSSSFKTVRPINWIAYNDVKGLTIRAQGYRDGQVDAAVMPISITADDRAGRVVHEIEAHPSGGDPRNLASRQVAQTNWSRWAHSQYDDHGDVSSERVYHSIPTNGSGSRGKHYDETRFGHDVMGRQDLVVSPGGTRTKTTFDARGLPLDKWVGTTQANMVDVERYQYDLPGSYITQNGNPSGKPGGDGRLSRTTKFAENDHVTSSWFDYRSQVVLERNTLSEAGQIPASSAAKEKIERPPTVGYAYTNQGEVRQTVIYESATTDKNTAHLTPIEVTENEIDVYGRAYRRKTKKPGLAKLWVHQWRYNAAGDVLMDFPPGSEVYTKTEYDGLGRAARRSRAYGNPTWEKVGGNDVVLEESQMHHDRAGNMFREFTRSRLPNVEKKGPLTTLPPRSVDTDKRFVYDPLGRRRWVVMREWDDPKSKKTQKKKERLISGTIYNQRGEPHLDYKVVDTSSGERRYRKTAFDDAGRVVSRIENTNLTAGAVVSEDENFTAKITYSADGEVQSLTFSNALTGPQTTKFIHGVSRQRGSQIDRSDLLSQVAYPNGKALTLTYNRQGETNSKTDPNGTVHKFQYDSLGRLRWDRATVAASVDQTVTAKEFRYDKYDRLIDAVSYNGKGKLVNRVHRDYNPHGLILNDLQYHNAASNGVGPTFSYSLYASHNQSRIRSLLYPAGKRISYSYQNQIDDNPHQPWMDRDVGRVSHFTWLGADGPEGHILAAYRYLGERYVSTVYLPDTAVGGRWQDKALVRHNWDDEAIDGFGRITDVQWRRADVGKVADWLKYEVNSADVRTFRSPWPDAPHNLAQVLSYDDRNRLTSSVRGAPKSSQATKIKPGSEIFAEHWLLDETGNWRAYLTDSDGGGSEDLLSSSWESRLQFIHNTTNQITGVQARKGFLPVKPEYDAAGNTIVIPQPNQLTEPYYCCYDAWNRLVKVSEPLGKGKSRTVAEYQYDALGRRTVKKTLENGALSEVRHFYYSPDWHVLEERIVKPQDLAKYDQNVKRLSADALILDRMYVWGLNGRDDLVARFRKTASPTGTTKQNLLIDEKVDEKLFVLSDPSGQPTALVDEYANVLERFDYHPYGRPFFMYGDFSFKSGSDYDWTNLFGGYTWDEETGLYHVRNRMYHPWLGRWLTPDPRGYKDGANLYQYAHSNPISFNDPEGELVFLVLGMVAIGVYGLGVSYAAVDDMNRALDNDDPEAFAEAQDDFTTGVGLVGFAITLPVGGMGGRGLGLIAEFAIEGAFTAGIGSYARGGNSGEVFRDTATGAALGAVTGAALSGVARLGGPFVRNMTRGGWRRRLARSMRAPRHGFGVNGQIGSLPKGPDSTVLRGLYLDQVKSTTFGVKLGIHNTIKKITTFGRSKWVTRADVESVLRNRTQFRVGASTVHKFDGGFVIGGRESLGYFNRATSHHEMMHIGQYIRNPNLIDTRPIGYIHEVIPSYVGTPELYGGGTIVIGGMVYVINDAIRD